MTRAGSNADATTARDADEALTQTVRIDPDRRRLALRVLAGVLALGAICVGFVVTLLHPDRFALHRSAASPGLTALARMVGLPWWTTIALGIAFVTGVIGLMRSVYRLQDVDPALIVSPRGLAFRPALFGEMARIPWTALRGIHLRRHKRDRFLVLEVEGIERYVARPGIGVRLQRLFNSAAPTARIRVNSPMSKATWLRTEGLVRRYLGRYGKNGAAAQTTAPAPGPAGPRA